jgi:acetyl esterase/lipase
MTVNAEHLLLWEGQPPASAPEDDFRPWLDLYLLPEPASHGAVLVCPGGGYTGRAPHEQAPIAARYNAAGFHAFVLQYRVAPHRHPAPLLDVSRALRLIRHHATDWHVDAGHIAVCGFSAGGHLTASIGVHFDLDVLNTGTVLDASSCRPDGLILAYPVISSGSFAHLGSFHNLLGPDPAPDMLTLMSLENQVTADTPPTFLWHTAEDAAVPVENSLAFARAMDRAGVPFELHVYPKGRHGLGLADEDPHVATWMDLSIAWLKEMGWS